MVFILETIPTPAKGKMWYVGGSAFTTDKMSAKPYEDRDKALEAQKEVSEKFDIDVQIVEFETKGPGVC